MSNGNDSFVYSENGILYGTSYERKTDSRGYLLECFYNTETKIIYEKQ
ncbi:MAG: hypothetical protein KAG96_06260 [Ichthyobacteriaceae bacterium]|nr:hypothetical protein [Ichthyobacteriaceae bacterium]